MNVDDDIERIGRTAGCALNAEVERRVDVESALRAARDGSVASVVPLAAARSNRRRTVWLGAAAVSVAAAVVSVVVVARHDSQRRLSPAGSVTSTVPQATATVEPSTSVEVTAPTVSAASTPPTTDSPPTNPSVAVTPSAPTTSALSNPPVTGNDPLGIGVGCVGGVGCPSIAVRPDGVVVSLDPTTGTITVHEPTARSFVVADLGDRDASLVAIGPYDVVYVIRDSAASEDPVGDILAIASSPAHQGEVLAAEEGVVDMSGDSDLVPASVGLVVVGCCGPDLHRPASDARVVMPWRDESGSVIMGVGPYMEVEIRDDGSLDVIRRNDGDQQLTWNIPGVSAIRGMPNVVATHDGGALIAIVDATGTNPDGGQLLKLAPDGTYREVSWPPFFTTWLEPAGTVIFPSDTEGYVRTDPFATGTETQNVDPASVDMMSAWPPPPQVAPDLARVPMFLPTLPIDGATAATRREYAGGTPTIFDYSQYWLGDGEPAAFLSITTNVAQHSNSTAGRAPVTVGSWDSAAFLSNTIATDLVLDDPTGYVELYAVGLSQAEVLAIASSMVVADGQPGWIIPSDEWKLMTVAEGWNLGAGSRTVQWTNGADVVAEMSIAVDLPGSLESPFNSDSVITRTTIGESVAVVWANDGRSAVSWSSQPGVVVVFGLRGSIEDALAIARSIAPVDVAAWEAASTPDVSDDDGCNSLFC